MDPRERETSRRDLERGRVRFVFVIVVEIKRAFLAVLGGLAVVFLIPVTSLFLLWCDRLERCEEFFIELGSAFEVGEFYALGCG